MRNLILPDGMASVTVFDQTFGEKGVIRDVEDHVAREILAHDPAIREFEPGGPDDPDVERSVEAKRAAFVSKISAMDRAQMFETSRQLKISFPANTRNEVMRQRLIENALTMDEADVPFVLSSEVAGTKEDGAIVLNSGDPNNGNDSAGRAGAYLTGGTDLTHRGAGVGGATFSQPQASPAVVDANAHPAPAGVGLVTPAGTTQPPYNQLNTEDGKPTGDPGAAPYPISVPPINPATGLPYREGDPNIPSTAHPILHADAPAPDQTPPVSSTVTNEDPPRPVTIPGEPGPQGQGAVKAGTPDPIAAAAQSGDPDLLQQAADADAAQKTAAAEQAQAAAADGLAPANPDAPLTDEAERLRREEAARAAEVAADPAKGTDPNHGNDAEGDKDKTEGLKN